MKKFMFLLVIVSLLAISGLSMADDAKKVTIYYEGNAQVELVSPQGTRVLIDVYDPSLLSAPATDKDVLLTTHGHSDHVSPGTTSFTGPSLYIKAGDIQVADVTIKGIPSSHFEDNTYLPEKGSNYIFIIDMAGMRIAHFGDIGQEALTPEQLTALGTVDIAITQLANNFSVMDIVNLKGFNLMEQIKPKMIVPAHDDIETAKYAASLWKTYFKENPLQISAADLKGPTKLVFVGEKKRLLSKIAKATPWPTK